MRKSTKRRRLLRRLLCITVVLLMALWIGLSPRVSQGLYNSKLFHPEKQRGTSSDLLQITSVKNHEVFFKAVDGSRLHGWMFFNPASTKVFLLHPGNSGDILGKLSFIKTLLQSGVSVFSYEPRGFGLSDGKPSVRSVCEDGVSAFDFLTETQGCQYDQIILYGVSLGAAVATYVSTHRQAAGLILQSGFASLEQIGKEHVPLLNIYPAWMFPRPSMNTAETLTKSHVPLLILHGDKDDIIPIAHSKRIFAKAAYPKQFVVCPNSTHTSIDQKDEKMFLLALSSFIRKLG